MLRIFLPLYLILAVFFISFVLASQFLPQLLLSSRTNRIGEQLMRGTFHLVEKELQGLTLKQQKAVITKLKEQFQFPIYLLKPGDPLLDKNQWKLIMDGGTVSVIDFKVHGNYKFFKKMHDSETILAIHSSDSQSELDHKWGSGTYALLEKIFLNHPQSVWHDVVKELQIHFGIPISLKLISELDSEEKGKINPLKNGRVVAFGHSTDQHRFMAKIADSNYVITVGPIEQIFTLPIYFFFLFCVLIFLLTIPLFFWFRPLWQSINELSQTADAFGSGKLQARASVKQSAVLGNLASQFNAMADRIGSLVSGHRELTNAVSHELRTPIARMRFGLDMMESADDTTRKRYMQGLSSDVDDLEILVNELLHYARFERSGSIKEQQIVEIIPWLESVVENAKGYADNLDITFNAHDFPIDQRVRFCPQYMTRAIHNLLRNACRYGKQEINVILDASENSIIIHVDDDGKGIPENDRKRVFEAFTRLDKSRDRQSGGHGLGLAIAQRIMNAHKGNISITDSPLGGARFTLCWPTNTK
jgi:signal transduction histidine kinase